MMQVWKYDENRVFTESIFVEELGENMTTTPLLVGYIKPTLNDKEEWFEDATEEEIKEWEEANKPIEVPNEMETLTAKVDEIIVENKKQTTNISTNSDMIFMTMDATTELNENNIQNTQMVLISMDALTEINEQLIALQEEINKLKGGVA